jgi:UMF1 family MFS transporter
MAAYEGINETTYRKRKRAWAMYDWANSAFATTILAAVLPAYYSSVAGANLPSEATATGYWSITLVISQLIVAVVSPILGTVSDVIRGKKLFLALFMIMGVVGTGLLVFIGTGDWLLASVLFTIGRTGFAGSLVFYDALLSHVAKPEDVDRLSATGYAVGYLGGGLLLAVNIIMIFVLSAELGARLSFLSVAIWWAIFSLPILRVVPEPPAVITAATKGKNALRASISQLRSTFRDMRQYRELFKFLIAFLIYNDGIGTIIGIAVIYGVELGFGTLELIAALLLVQFVGIPFSMIFGRLPYPTEKRRALFLAFILWNLVTLPLAGIAGRTLLDAKTTGGPLPDYKTVEQFAGTGVYQSTEIERGTFAADVLTPNPDLWQDAKIEDAEFEDKILRYIYTDAPDAAYEIPFNGETIELFYSEGPDRGIFRVLLDGEPYEFEDSNLGVGEIDAYRSTTRWNNRLSIEADDEGQHTLIIANTGAKNSKSDGTRLDLGRIEVLPPARQSNLALILGTLAAAELLGLAFAWTIGQRLVAGLAATLNTKRAVLLALMIYAVISVWGFVINAVLEFWLLAWMVAIVQGGSQALSRSLYASMSPSAKSGEFFGFFSVMEKFAGVIGPAIFAVVVGVFGSSRPAVLSLISLFIIGGWLLSRVNVDEGRRIAQAEDAELLGT